MALIDGMLRELEDEAVTTRRVLERVPDNRLGWRPHPKARTLGELALHVAIVPGGVAQLVASPSPAQAPQVGQDPSPASSSELMPALDQSIAARVVLNHWYHHRGQLTVYLRELGVPIPSIYGPSADENPFA